MSAEVLYISLFCLWLVKLKTPEVSVFHQALESGSRFQPQQNHNPLPLQKQPIRVVYLTSTLTDSCPNSEKRAPFSPDDVTVTTGFCRRAADENRSAADMDAYNYMYNISYVIFNFVHCGQGLFIICLRGMSGLVSLRACVAILYL